jgi:hypothetical protein
MKPITLPMAELKPALIGLGKLIQKSHGLPVLKTIKVERTTEGVNGGRKVRRVPVEK